ncbi:nitroreductase family deazaflavin-dependent oxidoreductase [Actinomycetospora endophytica]|uniref:Nitroreductase family deazaflavin-dependent oxidoreductase n=1 Tax=Actinomycetospora endophytica TaxID=2291215 RepID=A0ABS8PEQ9_9PSEU|nr:nitroreductase/quinone reductase family protein [Actinomycetospora endophytica]MCD2196757.1 nitroreductase family deazaflavin-dependent oxidoreductase [Actinomycetospora endophytica]
MTQPRARTLPVQSAVNRLVRFLLHVPLLNRLVGARLVVIEVVGRRSGTRYEVPVAYTREGDALLVGTPFAWGRNLRTGDPVTILLQGRRRTADVTAITDEPGVVEAYGIMARDNRRFADFNQITVDDDGEPSEQDLHLAWAGGARAFRLRPRT